MFCCNVCTGELESHSNSSRLTTVTCQTLLLSSILTIERDVALVVNAQRDMFTYIAATQIVRIILLNGVRILHFYMLGTQLFLQPQVLPDTDSCTSCPVLNFFFFAIAARSSEGNKVCRIQSLTHTMSVT